MPTHTEATHNPTDTHLLVTPQSMSEFVQPKAFAEQNKDKISEGGVKWLLRNKKDNGFDRCVVKIGRRENIHTPSAVIYFGTRR